ncbi:uncharacterized protein LOC107270914 [Cephus cinctus]|uniref:Uncharacterized protein LOC107270914 n=1 Tax=Cephus cinctus TaxID=211228 RepID=A0AAJ7C5D2_CEPCN|nr:uncharacterized protein LOC107270914 [Cephus cinctus]
MNITLGFLPIMATLWLVFGHCESIPETSSNVHRRFRSHPLFRGYDIDEQFSEDDDMMEINKRQFDDYGHMRFGKRDQFDDYGHLRFGRGHE